MPSAGCRCPFPTRFPFFLPFLPSFLPFFPQFIFGRKEGVSPRIILAYARMEKRLKKKKRIKRTIGIVLINRALPIVLISAKKKKERKEKGKKVVNLIGNR